MVSACPSGEPSLNNDQLAPLRRALALSIRSTAESFYQYMRAPEVLSSNMLSLFDQYLPTDDECAGKPFWYHIGQDMIDMPRTEFTQRLENAMALLEKNPRFRIYRNNTGGYSVTLPYAEGMTAQEAGDNWLLHDMLILFRQTRLQQAADHYAAQSRSCDGVLCECAPKCDFIEFETAKGLCTFVSACAPATLAFTPAILQAVRQ